MFSAATKESANSTMNEAKNTAYNAKRDLRDAGSEAKNDLSDIAQQTGRQVRGFIESANEQVMDAGNKVKGEIRSNPIRSSLIALSAGLVLGALFRRS